LEGSELGLGRQGLLDKALLEASLLSWSVVAGGGKAAENDSIRREASNCWGGKKKLGTTMGSGRRLCLVDTSDPDVACFCLMSGQLMGSARWLSFLLWEAR